MKRNGCGKKGNTRAPEKATREQSKDEGKNELLIQPNDQ